MQLYKLTENLKVLDEVEPIDDEERNRLKETLDALEIKIEDKIADIGKYLLGIKSDIDTLKTEETRLKHKRATLESNYEWLKLYVLRAIQQAMIEEVKRPVCTVKRKFNPPSVGYVNMDELIEDFIRIIPETREPNKQAIIEYFKLTGEAPSGAEIITTKESITIR